MPSLNSSTSRRRHNATDAKFKVMGDHKAFMTRIKKSLYYGKLPITDRFSLPITELAAELYTEVKSGYSLDRLDLEEAAVLSRNACVSPCSLVLALLYLERLKSCNPDYLHRVAPSELFLVSMLVASKFLQDDGEENEVFNEDWATSAGIDVKVLNQFERDFLQAIEWEVFVNEQAFWNRLSGMERDVALKEGRRRGWFTYTDLDNLMDSVDLAKFAQAVITVSAICLTSYTASVLTLIGSAFIVSQVPGTSLSQPSTPLLPPLLLNDSSTNVDVSQSRQVALVDTLNAKFILNALCSCANYSDSFNRLNTNVKTCTHSMKGWTDSSDWITDFLSSSWQWLNSKLVRLRAFNGNLSDKSVKRNINLEKHAMGQNFKFMFAVNKSWIWETENFWKDMQVWLLANRNERQPNFFSLPITSHY